MSANNDKTSYEFRWLNKPLSWKCYKSHGEDSRLEVVTKNKSDFWQGTWYNFFPNTGHVFGTDIKGDFVFSVCVEADFTTLYDQAGLMIYLDEKHWLKAGIEYNDGQPMIGSVLTNEVSDWATGIYPGNPRKFYIQMTRKDNVICVKYSTNNEEWILLRLCTMLNKDSYFIGPMCCTPQREGLKVVFSQICIGVPDGDILHGNTKRDLQFITLPDKQEIE